MPVIAAHRQSRCWENIRGDIPGVQGHRKKSRVYRSSSATDYFSAMESGSQEFVPNMKCAVVQDYMSASALMCGDTSILKDNHLVIVDSLCTVIRLPVLFRRLGLRCIA
jgi:hypothetical protein